MGVHPDHRGRGLGDRLIDVTLSAARERGLEQVELSVRTDNEKAIALYDKKGFTVVGTSPRAIKIEGAYYDCYSMLLIF
jgi:putative acetyltransferase